jgi:hypothetical protein
MWKRGRFEYFVLWCEEIEMYAFLKLSFPLEFYAFFKKVVFASQGSQFKLCNCYQVG